MVNHAEVEFTIAGQKRRLSRDEVVRKLKGSHPGTVQTHAVEIDGVLHPIKEAFARVTGLDLLDFNTNQARRILKHLGLRVVRVS
jgi:hypothetical protein